MGYLICRLAAWLAGTVSCLLLSGTILDRTPLKFHAIYLILKSVFVCVCVCKRLLIQQPVKFQNDRNPLYLALAAKGILCPFLMHAQLHAHTNYLPHLFQPPLSPCLSKRRNGPQIKEQLGHKHRHDKGRAELSIYSEDERKWQEVCLSEGKSSIMNRSSRI